MDILNLALSSLIVSIENLQANIDNVTHLKENGIKQQDYYDKIISLLNIIIENQNIIIGVKKNE